METWRRRGRKKKSAISHSNQKVQSMVVEDQQATDGMKGRNLGCGSYACTGDGLGRDIHGSFSRDVDGTWIVNSLKSKCV